MAFAHLHVHSQYSILDGTMDPAAVAKRAAALGFSHVALTDTNNLYGAVAFYKACKSAGIKAVIGAELHLAPGGLLDDDEPLGGADQIVALVEDEVGYKNLCALVTRAIFDGMRYKPRIDLDSLRAHRQGLIFLTGGRRGLIGNAAARQAPEQAATRLRALAEILGPEHFFVELVDHGHDEDAAWLQLAREQARAAGLRTVVTNAVHYADPEGSAVHEALNAIAGGWSLSDPKRPRAHTDQAWLKPEAELRALFPDDGEALDLAGEIAARCHFSFTFGTYHFPATTPPDVNPDGSQPDTDANWAYFYRAFPPPRDYGLPDPTDAIPPRPEGAGNLNGYFGWYSERGLDLRLQRIPEDRHAEYRARLDLELKMIQKMGFPAYLLIVAEFINWSKDNDIPVGPGRGSAAGSLVAYAMRITDIDPIRFELLFERFLNPERVSMPDIDVDFCQDRREEAIEHVREKYGSPLVSQIITYGKLKAKAAVRDVARILDLPFGDADRLAKLVPDDLNMTLETAIAQSQPLRDMIEGEPKVRRVMDLARAVEGLCRQTGVHAAGVVIADRPLVEYAPLYRDQPGGGPVVQYDMKSAESIGLIKFDFLGLKTLDQIRDAVKMIERNHGVRIDMSAIDVDDAPTYQLLQRGDALGIFQLESSGMRDLLARLRPSVLDDLVALVALYRPGPLNAGMTDDFVERKHGRKKVEYPFAELEPILSSTYGTVVYQEQVMQIAQVLAGYRLGDADLLRRAMGKKDAKEMAQHGLKFVEGAKERGHDPERARELFSLLAEFAEYGFNKSHSAAYGYISYQTAWLKTHYRAEYMAALMTIEAGNTDKVLTYIQDCKAAGIEVKPVCVNQSSRAFEVPAYKPGETPTIRYGLAAVKGIGAGAIEAIVEARQAAGGAFRSAFDFFERVDFKKVNRRVVEALVKAGAFDPFGVERAALFGSMEAAMAAGVRAQDDRAAGQVGLFGALAGARAPQFRFPEDQLWPLSQKLAFEKEVLGLYLTGHPMQAHEADVRRHATPIEALAKVPGNQEVRVLALPIDVRTTKTKRGDKMGFVRVEDASGSVECVFFSEPWARSQRVIQAGEPVLVSGKLESSADGPKIIAQTAELLSDVRRRATKLVRFRLRAEELAGDRIERFKALLAEQRGEAQSALALQLDGRAELEFDLPQHPVDPGVGLEDAVQILFRRTGAVELT